MSAVKWQIQPPWRKTEIKPIPFVRETDHFIWIPSKRLGCAMERYAKRTDYTEYHDSWEAARDRLAELAETDLRNARARLLTAQGFAGNVKGLCKPEETQRSLDKASEPNDLESVSESGVGVEPRPQDRQEAQSVSVSSEPRASGGAVQRATDGDRE